MPEFPAVHPADAVGLEDRNGASALGWQPRVQSSFRRTRSSNHSTNAANLSEQPSASPGFLAPLMTEPSGLSAHGSIPGPASVTSRLRCTVRDSTSSWRSTTSVAGGRPFTRRGWSTCRWARRAPEWNRRRGTRYSGRRWGPWTRRQLSRR